MAKKLYVGNLPYPWKSDKLNEVFSQIGPVTDAVVLEDKMNPGRSRGFGFVTMEDADADKAIAELNGKEMDGRALTVNEARPKTEGERRPRRNF